MGRTVIGQGLIDPAGAASEPFRGLRLTIDRSPLKRADVALAFTSPSTRDGTSTLASNYALVSALVPRRTVLIDANLRRPSLHERLGHPRRPGLADLLAGQADLDEVVQPSLHGGARLSLVPAGDPGGPSADLLGSPTMANLVDALCARFDSVVVDCPAVLGLPDAATIAALPNVDTLIVADRRQRRDRLLEAVAELERAGASVVGVVLNRWRAHAF